MTLQGGDRKFGHGDQITVENASGSPIEAGELLAVTGYNTSENRPKVAPANATDDKYHAVAGVAIPDGGYGQGHFNGTPLVLVDDGADVSAGQEVAPSSLDGVATDSTSGGSGKGDVFLTGELVVDETTYAVVHLG